MLRVSVNTNSVSPRANATSVCGELNSRSPVSWLTIFTVIVVTGSSGLSVRFAAMPAASTTIMVSPMAREAASSTAPTIPGSAAGSTTRRMVSDCVAPSP